MYVPEAAYPALQTNTSSGVTEQIRLFYLPQHTLTARTYTVHLMSQDYFRAME